jgi:FkbM family methyltransferase
MISATIRTLSWLLWRVPDGLPGKTRLGHMLLRPFRSRRPATLNDSGGCSFVLPSFAEPIAQDIFTFGAYEAGTRRLILEHLPERGVFLDIGANIGAITIPITKARPLSTAVCVEADPNIYQLLKDNLERNDSRNVRTFSCVAGSADDKPISFYRAPEEKFGMGSIARQFDVPPITLKLWMVDTLLAEMDIETVDVIKIDVEGAELGVLRGARRLLSSGRPPVIVFEFADWAENRIPGQQAGDAQAELLSLGYRLFQVQSDGKTGTELLEPMRQGSSMILALPERARLQS